jgi:hypothetical protein
MRLRSASSTEVSSRGAVSDFPRPRDVGDRIVGEGEQPTRVGGEGHATVYG